ncbi:dihydroorotase [Synechococcus sp. PCC 6312]|uniref:dihydroorotase n=1 Tax=Synechococcus sp. (strain ATCC 27167 / PCC 6312) TaxID=195253 RepID=UPI00029F23AA|nr:dihydroorotase [Synechococcus sp. PCC 6312]AFY60900.1 dihydroorotase, multifunctional complex type [Synechococcus sp. PCC 6312]
MTTTPISQILIKNAEVLLPEGLSRVEVLLDAGKISQLGPDLETASLQNLRVIDGAGLVLMPGVIDPQVHFREPGLEHKEDLFSASCACAHGGVTSFLEMPNTNPLTITQAALTDKLQRAAQKSLVNYGFFIGATAENLPDLRTANPTPGIKIFMGSMHGDLLVDQEAVLEPIFYRDLSDSNYENRLIAVHAEDQARIKARLQEFAGRTDVAIHSLIQDNQAALNATQLALKLSKKYHRRLHILHMSTAEEAELLRTDKPAWVTAEVTPQHLFLNTDAYETIGTLAKMNPPLRSPQDQAVLWQALVDGVVDFIATDHAPHTLAEKGQDVIDEPLAEHPATVFLEPANAPSGMPGVETALPLMLTQAKQGKCTIAQVSQWMSFNVAQAYKIPNKGLIATGYDADVILVDMNTYKPVVREELFTKCGWSPFEGWNLTGWPVYTIVGGQVAYGNGKLNTDVRGNPLEFNI